jgi:hypothetical protein
MTRDEKLSRLSARLTAIAAELAEIAADPSTVPTKAILCACGAAAWVKGQCKRCYQRAWLKRRTPDVPKRFCPCGHPVALRSDNQSGLCKACARVEYKKRQAAALGRPEPAPRMPPKPVDRLKLIRKSSKRLRRAEKIANTVEGDSMAGDP